MSDYCLLPRSCQKDYAAYLTSEYGLDYAHRYLAVVTNPEPNPTSKKPGARKRSGTKQLPQINLAPLGRQMVEGRGQKG